MPECVFWPPRGSWARYLAGHVFLSTPKWYDAARTNIKSNTQPGVFPGSSNLSGRTSTNLKGISGWIFIFTSRTEPNSAINCNFLPRVLMENQCIQPNPNLMLPNLQFPWMCIPLGFYFHPQNGLPSHWGRMQSVPGNLAIKSELTRVYTWKCWKWPNLQHVQWSIISRNSSSEIWAHPGCTFGNAGSNQQNVQWSIIARKSSHKIWVKPGCTIGNAGWKQYVWPNLFRHTYRTQ